jgi:hypothetical protein
MSRRIVSDPDCMLAADGFPLSPTLWYKHIFGIHNYFFA